MKSMIAGVAALALLAAPLPAAADNGCFGCNVRDAGAFDTHLVGQTVYVEDGAEAWGRVVRVNPDSGRAQVRMANGDLFETSATQLYSRASRTERTNATVVGIAAVAMVAICVMGACGDDENSEPAPKASRGHDNPDRYAPGADIPELDGAP
jgi:hypothetical protein